MCTETYSKHSWIHITVPFCVSVHQYKDSFPVVLETDIYSTTYWTYRCSSSSSAAFHSRCNKTAQLLKRGFHGSITIRVMTSTKKENTSGFSPFSSKRRLVHKVTSLVWPQLPSWSYYVQVSELSISYAAWCLTLHGHLSRHLHTGAMEQNCAVAGASLKALLSTSNLLNGSSLTIQLDELYIRASAHYSYWRLLNSSIARPSSEH